MRTRHGALGCLVGLGLAIGASVALAPVPAAAQTDWDATRIIRGLNPADRPRPPQGAPPPQIETREVEGFIDGRAVRVIIDLTRRLDFQVFFAHDSSELLPRARNELRNLGRALSSPELTPHSFLIAGHTNTLGPFDHNMRLSLERALAVKAYLVQAHGIHPNRLVVAGFGPTMLLNRDNPTSGANRRVEVALIVPPRAETPRPQAEEPAPAPAAERPAREEPAPAAERRAEDPAPARRGDDLNRVFTEPAPQGQPNPLR